ncbi:MAG: hypothetical protein AAF797_17575 [Planctomycetota bacterium]
MPDATATLKPLPGAKLRVAALDVSNEPKPGFKTTEFWLSIVVVFVSLLGGSGAIGPDSELFQAISTIAAAFATAGYGYSRAKVKALPPVPVPPPTPLPPLESAPSPGAAKSTPTEQSSELSTPRAD